MDSLLISCTDAGRERPCRGARLASRLCLRLILISNKMLYLKSRVFHTLVPHVPCVTPSHKNLTRLAL